MPREDLLNELTGSEPAEPTEVENPAPTDPVDPPEPEPADKPVEPAVDPHATSKAFLDTISEPDPNAAPRGADGKLQPKEGDKPAVDPKPDAAKPDVKPDAAKTPEQEAEALIQEMGVKSERGQERIKQVFAKAKEAEGKATQLEADITEFREMVTSTGMTPTEFAETLEFGRLLKSGDETSLKTALEMVNQQRELICKQLGIEAPGVDPLADFPELKKSVDNMEVSRAHALELARYKRQDQTRQQVQQTQHTSQQQMQEYQQTLKQAGDTAEAYFKTREKEVDFPVRIAQIQTKFKDPAFVNEFVTTYEPKQWVGILKMMYDSVVVPAAPRTTQNQPARSSQMMSGKPAANANASLTERLTTHIDSLGI